MKHCIKCHDTSPNDALFCIGCGASFAHTGPTQRLESSAMQTSLGSVFILVDFYGPVSFSAGSSSIERGCGSTTTSFYGPVSFSAGSSPYWVTRSCSGYGVSGSVPSAIVRIVP